MKEGWLVTLGVASILAAIVGGGFKALGVEVAVIHTKARQVLLAVSGFALLTAAAVIEYRQNRVNPADELNAGLQAYDEEKFFDARAHLRIAATAGIPEAQYHFGEMIYHGEGGSPEPAEGMAWLQRSAENGFALAEDSLAFANIQGKDGFSVDKLQARKWADRAASQGDCVGFYLRALLEENNPSLNDMTKAAEAGYAPAQRLLATYLLKARISDGKIETFAQVSDIVKWLRRAANQGDRNAQALLAFVLVKHSVNKEAYQWAFTSMEARTTPFDDLDQKVLPRLVELQKRMESELSQDDLEDVWQQTRQWSPKLERKFRHGHCCTPATTGFLAPSMEGPGEQLTQQ